MATKFEIEQSAVGLRAIRQANIDTIQRRLDECNDLLAVMPNRTFEEQQDRRFIVRMRHHYIDLLADEKRAYDNAYNEAEIKLNGTN